MNIFFGLNLLVLCVAGKLTFYVKESESGSSSSSFNGTISNPFPNLTHALKFLDSIIYKENINDNIEILIMDELRIEYGSVQREKFDNNIPLWGIPALFKSLEEINISLKGYSSNCYINISEVIISINIRKGNIEIKDLLIYGSLYLEPYDLKEAETGLSFIRVLAEGNVNIKIQNCEFNSRPINSLWIYLYSTLVMIDERRSKDSIISIEISNVTFNSSFFPSGIVNANFQSEDLGDYIRPLINITNISLLYFFSKNFDPIMMPQYPFEFAFILSYCDFFLAFSSINNSPRLIFSKIMNNITIREVEFNNLMANTRRPELIYIFKNNNVRLTKLNFTSFYSYSRDDVINNPRDDTLLYMENMRASGLSDDEKTQSVIKFYEQNNALIEDLNINDMRLVKLDNYYFMFIGIVLSNKVELKGSIIKNISLESNSNIGALLLILAMEKNILEITNISIYNGNTNSFTISLILGAVVNNTVYLKDLYLEAVDFRHKASQREVLKFYLFVGEIGDKIQQFLALRSEQIRISSFSAFLALNKITVQDIIFKEVVCLGNCFMNAFIFNSLTVSGLFFENLDSNLVSAGILLQSYNNITVSRSVFGQSKSISGSLFNFAFNNLLIVDCSFKLNAALSVVDTLRDDERLSVAGTIYLGQYNNVSILSSIFNQNKCDLYGGAITVFRFNQLSIKNTSFNNTQSINRDSKGGALFIFELNTVTIEEVYFQGNLGFSGGVLFIGSLNLINIIGCNFVKNFAVKGGVAFVDRNNILNIFYSEFIWNEASLNGIMQVNGSNNTLEMKDSSVYSNKASLRHCLFGFNFRSKAIFNKLVVDYNMSGISSFLIGSESVSIFIFNSIFYDASDVYSMLIFYTKSRITIKNSTFFEISTSLLEADNLNNIMIENCSLKHFNSSDRGKGLIYIMNENDITIKSTILTNIYGEEGAIISAENKNILEIISSTFQQIKAVNPGSWFFFYSGNVVSSFNASFRTFESIESKSVFLRILNRNDFYFYRSNFTGSIYNLGANASFFNILGEQNAFEIYVSSIYLVSKKYITDNSMIFIRIEKTDNRIGISFINASLTNFQNGIVILGKNFLRVVRAIVTNSKIYSGFLLLNYLEEIILNSCALYNNKIIDSNGYFLTINGCSSAKILFLELKNCPKLLSCSHSTLKITRSFFSFKETEPQIKPYFYFEGSVVNIFHSGFHLMNNIYSSNLFFNESSLTIYSNEFLLNKAIIGGVFYLLYSPSALFLLNKFIKNHAVMGGAIYCDESFKIEISNNDFIINQASSRLDLVFNGSLTGFGGCLYIHITIKNNTKTMISYKLKTNNFIGNIADVGGVYYFEGRIFLANLKNFFLETSNTYTKNKAKNYGPIYSTTIYKIVPDKDIKRTNKMQTEFTIFLREDIKMTPENDECYFKVFCLDYFGHPIIGYPYLTDLQSVVNDDYLFIMKSKGYYLCLNDVKLNYTEKRFRFSENTFLSLFFTSRQIIKNYTHDADLIYELQNFTIYFKMEYCRQGEYLDPLDMKCKPCQTNFYSFVSKINKPSSCINCESQNFFCYGGSNLSPKKGFWRNHENSSKFLKCPLKEACLGDINMVHSDSPQITGEKFELTFPSGTCALGHKGPLCSLCQDGYSKSENKKCIPCGNWITITVFILKIIFKLLVFSYMIYNAMKLGQKLRENTADNNLILSNFLMKIVIEHVQFIRLILVLFSIDYGDYALNTVSFFTAISSSTPDVTMSLVCLKFNFGIPYKYINSMFVIFLPMAAVLTIKYFHFSVFKEMFINCFRCKRCKSKLKPSRNIKKHLSQIIKHEFSWISTIIICVMLSFDSIAVNLIEYFPEINIGDENYKDYRLLVYLDVEASEDLHRLWKYFFVVPLIIIYVAGIPSLIFYKIIKMKRLNKLNDPRTLFRYGYFYFAYNKKFYFYELIYISRKMILILIDVFLARLFDLDETYNAITYLILLMVLFMISAAFSRFYKPFNNENYKLLNDIECFSFIAQAMTCSIGCFSLSLKMENSARQIVNETLRKAFLSIGTLINLLFILLWVFHYWKVQAKPVIIGMMDSIRKCINKPKHLKNKPVSPKDSSHQPTVDFLKLDMPKTNEIFLFHDRQNLIKLENLDDTRAKPEGKSKNSERMSEPLGAPFIEAKNKEILLKLVLKENKKLRFLVEKLIAENKVLKLDQDRVMSVTEEGTCRKSIKTFKEPKYSNLSDEINISKDYSKEKNSEFYLKPLENEAKYAGKKESTISLYETEILGDSASNCGIKITFQKPLIENENLIEFKIKPMDDDGFVVASPKINTDQNEQSNSISFFARCFQLKALLSHPQFILKAKLKKIDENHHIFTYSNRYIIKLSILDFFKSEELDSDTALKLRNETNNESFKTLRSYNRLQFDVYSEDIKKLRINYEIDSLFSKRLRYLNDDLEFVLFNIIEGEHKIIILHCSKVSKLIILYNIFNRFLTLLSSH